MLKWSLSYAQAEATLARIHGRISAEVQKNAFRGRLKHLKRLGVPRGINPGRGAKVYYLEEHLYEWAFCLELAEFGIDPTLIVRLIDEKWESEILPKFERAGNNPPSGDDLYFVVWPQVMGAALDDQKVALPFEWWKQSKLATYAYRLKRRTMLLNVSELCRAIGEAGVAYHSSKKPGQDE